jgi:hypothetical protein
MARLVSIKIDLSKIDENRVFHSQKTGARYLDITGVLTDTPDQYQNNGFVKQNTTKEEREAGVNLPIIGNFKLLKILDQPAQSAPAQPIQSEVNPIDESSELPF